jgi:hypothetical protein
MNEFGEKVTAIKYVVNFYIFVIWFDSEKGTG